jgi:hypothetical protein
MRKAACISACLLLASCSGCVDDPYVPSVQKDGAYQFTQDQLDRMKNTPLNRELFLLFIEAQWTIEKLRSICTPSNRIPLGIQNLVATRLLFDSWELPVHHERDHDFDKISVYVSEDRGDFINY